MASRKPITMRCNELVNEYCLTLAAQSLQAPDKVLLHFARLQRVIEDIANCFGYEAPKQQPPSISVEGVALLVEAFKAQLDSLRTLLPPEASSNCDY